MSAGVDDPTKVTHPGVTGSQCVPHSEQAIACGQTAPGGRALRKATVPGNAANRPAAVRS